MSVYRTIGPLVIKKHSVAILLCNIPTCFSLCQKKVHQLSITSQKCNRIGKPVHCKIMIWNVQVVP